MDKSQLSFMRIREMCSEFLVFGIIVIIKLNIGANCNAVDNLDNNNLAGFGDESQIVGDMIMNKIIGLRTISTKETEYWPGGIIPYYIDQSYSSIEKDKIVKIMRYIESVSCVRFLERKYETDYVYIYKGQGCNSNVGFGKGVRYLSLAPNCFTPKVMTHELMHTLGFTHEHSRPDRDKYIEIKLENVVPNFKYWFNLVFKGDDVTEFLPFDFDSVMMYTAYAASVDRSKPTIVSKIPGITVKGDWDFVGLSHGDIYSINKVYNCPVPPFPFRY